MIANSFALAKLANIAPQNQLLRASDLIVLPSRSNSSVDALLSLMGSYRSSFCCLDVGFSGKSSVDKAFNPSDSANFLRPASSE